ncbi:laforin [Pongo pygmaeus]|uniref:laforin n=1 Tax=Pongo pygmaeus TaxID=9600 RepID=UPI00300C12EF
MAVVGAHRLPAGARGPAGVPGWSPCGAGGVRAGGRGRGGQPPALLRAGSFRLVLREELPGDPRVLKPPLGSSGPARRLRGERGSTDAFRPDPSPLPRTSGLCARVNNSNWHVSAFKNAARFLTLRLRWNSRHINRAAGLSSVGPPHSVAGPAPSRAPEQLRPEQSPARRQPLSAPLPGPAAPALLRGPACCDLRSVEPYVLWLLCCGVFRLESRLQGSSAVERGSGPRSFSLLNNIPWYEAGGGTGPGPPPLIISRPPPHWRQPHGDLAGAVRKWR